MHAPPKILLKLFIWSICLINFSRLLSVREACTPDNLFLKPLRNETHTPRFYLFN